MLQPKFQAARFPFTPANHGCMKYADMHVQSSSATHLRKKKSTALSAHLILFGWPAFRALSLLTDETTTCRHLELNEQSKHNFAMDPLSAFALAGTVYTFIDAGITVTKFAKELSEFWKSSRETMESVGHLTVTTQNLQALSSELRNVDEPLYMKTIAAECAALCQELSGLLDKLRVKDKKSKTQHFSVMVSAYRRKDKISSIEDRLGKLRAQMTLDLLRSLSHGQSDIKKMLDEMQLDIRKLSTTHSESFRKRRSELLDLLQAYEKDRPQDHSAIINELRNFQSEVFHEKIQNQILQTLRFDGMYSREDNTSEATEGTFRWLLIKNRRFEKRYVRNNKTRDKMQATREAFLAWLESGEGIFHVCGKAGSGKSTLMKLICTNSRTRGGLNVWAGDETLLHASFFFFAPGEKEAKSLTGLYRCVLFTILNEHRDLMSKVYPDEFLYDRQVSPRFLDLKFLDLIRPQRLEKAVQSLIEIAAAGAYKMCIFIDGLDEYEGSFTDYWQFADRLLGWADQSSGRVKFCVSSRPEVQFVKTFGSKNETSMRQIHLQEFTSGDIEKHCHDQFAKSSWFKNSDTVSNYDKFVEHIVERAEGVFLWAVLVTKVLLYETRKDGFERDLWSRLEEIPDDINDLYRTLFNSMTETQKRKCNLILLTVLTNPFREPLNARSLNFIYDEEDLDQALLKQRDADHSIDHERQKGLG
ncbi:hypothetical protein BJ166DRAFT_385100 [Pestalotiopsis sp. NC0098]|nr:hypothetical protein BJ166DRAFT_385100 [Pestalotiopsis sp. NC0098]